MEVVFDTRTLASGKRRQAWRDAICEIYLQVDCRTDPDVEYAGLVREARLGEVTITDAVISPQTIRRGNHHISRFGKDCYYLGIEHIGAVDIRQSGRSFVLRPGRGSLYYANEPYELHSDVQSRQFWIELPRAAFDRRFDASRPRGAAQAFRSHARAWPHRRRILRDRRDRERRPGRGLEIEARRAVHGSHRPGAEFRTRSPIN